MKIKNIFFLSLVLVLVSCHRKSVKSPSISPKKPESKTEIVKTDKQPIKPLPQEKKEQKPPKLLVNFENSEMVSAALEKAKAENKLVFLEMYTTWCEPCKTLDKQVFTNPDMANFLNSNFVNMHVDAEKGNGINLTGIFDIKVYPTVIFLDQKGNILERKDGAVFFTDLYNLGRSALSAKGMSERLK